MTLPLYTSEYEDVDAQIFGADNLVNEFARVATFLNPWVDSVAQSTTIRTYSETVEGTDTLVEVDIDPTDGSIQRYIVEESVSAVLMNFGRRAVGDTFRVYAVLRFSSKDSTFKVSGPMGATHLFGVNRTTFQPSQVKKDGYYMASLVATYGTNGLLINVFANNEEASSVSGDDIITAVSV